MRHGLIAGATGTGKTVTLRTLSENFSRLGIPVFEADVKGDLSGLCRPGVESTGIMKRIDAVGLTNFRFGERSAAFRDVFGEQGLPACMTISETRRATQTLFS